MRPGPAGEGIVEHVCDAHGEVYRRLFRLLKGSEGSKGFSNVPIDVGGI